MKQEADYYAVLQVDPRAETEVIQAAYRRLAAKYHPDVGPSPGASERMKLLNTAYGVLADPERKKAYDLHRASRRRQPWWLPRGMLRGAPFILAAVVIVAMAFRLSPRSIVMLGLLFLVLWLVWSRLTSKSD